MKILAFGDMHASKRALKEIEKKAKKADILVCCGDFTIFGNGTKEILRFFSGLKKELILIHGNHEDEKEVERESRKYGNIHFIHKKSIKIGDYEFIGHGGEGFSLRSREFEGFAKKFEKSKNLILITHAPPYGTRLDKLRFGHCGNKSYSDFIKRAQPLLVICGHLHENELKKDKIGETLIVNPGPYGTIIEVK